MWSLGANENTEAAWIVSEYYQRKMLSDVGYRFDASKLSTFKVEAFTVIANQLSKIEREQAKKMRAKQGRGR